MNIFKISESINNYKNVFFPQNIKHWLEVFVLAIMYVFSAKLGQQLAIPPGNVTAVWIPSGIIVAALFVRGYYLWPGIFIGAFVGNVSAYIDFTSSTIILKSLFAGTLNGIGDTLCTIIGVWLIHKYSKNTNFLQSSKGTFSFIVFGVILGSAISALFGVTGLALSGFISLEDYGSIFYTWFTGDAVGIIVLTPLLISLYLKNDTFSFNFEVIIFLIVLIVVSLYMSGILNKDPFHTLNLLIFPLLLWSVFRFDYIMIPVSIFVISVVSIVAAFYGYGMFYSNDLNNYLIELQFFIAIISSTFLILNAVVAERNKSRKEQTIAATELEELNKSLEEKVRHRTKELEQKNEELETLYITDRLTGVYNRYKLDNILQYELNKIKRQPSQLGLIMIDIDYFKKVNDTHGHQVGDQVLTTIAQLLQKNTREVDTLGRWGGEEFLIVSPEASLEGLQQLAEKLRYIIEVHHFTDVGNLTISVGLALYKSNDSMQSIIKRADAALYNAKNNGRNRVEVL